MKKTLLYFLLLTLFFCAYSENQNEYYKKIQGKWYFGFGDIHQSCGIPPFYEGVIDNRDSFIVFNKNKTFYIVKRERFKDIKNDTGTYYIQNIPADDSVSTGEKYLFLDSIQYDIIISNENMHLSWYYRKFEPMYKWIFNYYLSKKKWKE